MIITCECNMKSGWQVDYEGGVDIIIDGLMNFVSDLEKITPADKIMPGKHASNYLCQQYYENGGKEPEKEGLKLQIVDVASGKSSEALIPYWGNEEEYQTYPCSDKLPYQKTALVQTLRDYLAATKGQEYLLEEREAICDALNDKNRACPADLKFNHPQKPLPIKKLKFSIRENGRKCHCPYVKKMWEDSHIIAINICGLLK